MNLFSITSLIIFVSSIGFGLSLYSGDRTLKINREWFLFSFFIGLWSLGLFGVTWSNTAQAALIWQYLLDVSAIFVPVLYFSFASELVGLKNKIWQMFSYLLALLLAIFSFTPYFKTGMSIRYGSFYWIDPGSLYIIFPIFFLAYIIVCLVIYIRAYRKSTDRLFRSQMINMFLASAVGFGGGITNFLPQILNIYPFGNFLVLLYLFFMSYGVLKYKFISKKIVSAQLLVGAIVLVFLFNFLQMLQVGSASTESSILIGLLLLVLVSIFGVLVVRGVYREVAQREKIELLAKNLESANKAQAETMNFITHQIRGVFADTKAGLAAIIEGDLGAVGDLMKNTVSRMLEAQNRGVSDVETFLKAVHIENGTIEYNMKSFDFKQMVIQLADQEKARAESKKLQYEVHIEDGDYNINGDQTYLGQVVSNLIDNAIRYTPAGSVETNLARKDDKIIFSVKDSGVGVNEEDGKKLFTKYGHGKDSRRINTESNGLGLFIVKGIIDGHYGKIWYESTGAGKGTTFVVELPVAQK